MFQLGNLPITSKPSNINFRREKKDVNSFKTFIELVEKGLIQPCNYNKIKINVIKKERKALKNMQHDELRSYRVQDKGFRFVVLDNQDYIEKSNYQLKRSFFEELDYDPSKTLSDIVNLWIQKSTRINVLCKTWQKFIERSHIARKMFGLVKTDKDGNPVKIITNGCGIAVQNLSIFVERCLYPEVLKIESRIQDASEILNFIDRLNESYILTGDSISLTQSTCFPVYIIYRAFKQ